MAPRKPRRGRGSMADFGLDPVSAAKKRIEVCERFGMTIDPRDVQIVADAEKEK